LENSIRVAQVRVLPEKGNLQGNFQALTFVLDQLEDESFDVLITPECFLDGYVVTETSVSAAALLNYAIDPHKSPYTQALAAWASRRGVWVIFGCTRRVSEGAYNTALIMNRAGVLVDIYDKTHLLTHDVKYAAGQRLPVFSSDFGPFGVMICADRRWPETVRTLALKGARVIFNPTYGMHDERNLCMMRTRSYESEIAIAFTHPQQSLVTGANGEILCNEVCSDTTYSITEIDLARVDARRDVASRSHLTTRRTDLYID